MKVLVCGGRGLTDEALVHRILDEQHRVIAFTHLIHGNATGADQLADKWAHSHGVQRVSCPADWSHHGRGGGPIRNQRMIELRPDLVIAFPGGAGTANMVAQARDANIQVLEVTV